MILGLLYAKIFPEPVHVFKNGCTLFKTKLLQSDSNVTGVIGGPIGVFDHLADQTGLNAAMNWMMTTAQNFKDFRPRMDFGSVQMKHDKMMLEHIQQEGLLSEEGFHELLMDEDPEDDEEGEAEPGTAQAEEHLQEECGLCAVRQACTIQNDFKKFQSISVPSAGTALNVYGVPCTRR